MIIFFSLLELTAEATRVIEMRLRMMALGRATTAEMFLMVTEKLAAIEDARVIIAQGGTPALVVDNYRKIVAANVARLSARPPIVRI